MEEGCSHPEAGGFTTLHSSAPGHGDLVVAVVDVAAVQRANLGLLGALVIGGAAPDDDGVGGAWRRRRLGGPPDPAVVPARVVLRDLQT